MNNVNPGNFMNELNNFANTVQGDPKQQVQELLNSGKMDQNTYSMYSRVAEAFTSGNPMQAVSMIFGKK